jgi:hypothetical protein
MNWYYEVSKDPSNLAPIVMALQYFDEQYEEARKDITIKGLLERDAAKIPGTVEHRWSQLQELEAILEFLENEFKRVKIAAFKKYFESYQRTLTSREAGMYADADDKVLEISEIKNQVALVRNKFLGIMKGLESKSFAINNITKLRCAGLEDAQLNY